MHSTALSTIVALPVDQTSSSLREYSYRTMIGRGRSAEGMVKWHPSDDVAESGELEFLRIDPGHTRVVLTIDSTTDELAVTRRYQRFLEGFRVFAEGEAVMTQEMPLRRAA